MEGSICLVGIVDASRQPLGRGQGLAILQLLEIAALVDLKNLHAGVVADSEKVGITEDRMNDLQLFLRFRVENGNDLRETQICDTQELASHLAQTKTMTE